MRHPFISVVATSVLGFALVFSSESLVANLTVPSLTGPVVDLGNMMSASEEAQVEQRLRGFYPQVQMQVLTVPSLDGEPIESFSIRVVDAWKLGEAKKDNGLLILLARDDRAVRIEVGQGLEGEIGDALAGRIIDHLMVPRFREGQFAGGVMAALDEIAFRLKLSEASPLATAEENEKLPSGSAWLSLLFLLYIAFVFVMAIGRALGFIRPPRGGHWNSGGFGGPSSFGGGGFGGGGFGGGWSGGGGGFSGGGGSGRW